MDVFLSYLSRILDLFMRPMTIYGFTFSLWNVALFSTLGTICFKFVERLLND